jgi:hypothetical protein
MSGKRRFWTFLAWAICIPTALLLLWSAGFLYWRLRMARALADLQRETEARMDVMNPPPSLFSPAGSRAIPYLLRELRDAISRGDRKIAIVLYREVVFAAEAAEAQASPKSRQRTRHSLIPNSSSIDHLQRVLEETQRWWVREQADFPPSWMWWEGGRRKSE